MEKWKSPVILVIINQDKVKSQPNFLTKFLNLAKNLRLSHKVISYNGRNWVKILSNQERLTLRAFFLFFVCSFVLLLFDCLTHLTNGHTNLTSPCSLLSFLSPSELQVRSTWRSLTHASCLLLVVILLHYVLVQRWMLCAHNIMRASIPAKIHVIWLKQCHYSERQAIW